MILPPDEDATHILGDDDGIVDGIPIGGLKPQPGVGAPAPAMPSDLPPQPKVMTDPFGVPAIQEPAAEAKPARADTAEIDLKAKGGGKTSVLLLIIVGLVAGAIFGAVGFFVGRPGEVSKPKPPPPPPASATVLVKASTPVTVILDDKAPVSAGKKGALLLHPLKAGKHELTFTAARYKRLKAEFEVKPGQVLLLGPYALKEADKPSTLVIVLSDLYKDAEVRLAGKVVPSINVGKPIPLPLNTKVELRVGMLGYDDHVETIDTSHDKLLKTKKISLVEAVMGQVAVDSVPPGAAILLNGQKRDCVTPCRIQYLVRHKKFKLQLTMPGYETYQVRFDFKKRRIYTIDRRLKKSS